MAIQLKLSPSLKMSQKLVMTPMLQQAIKLLPLARLELAQKVRQEITENPVLEEIIEEEEEELQDKTEIDEDTEVSEPKENFEVTDQKDEGVEHTLENPDMDWDTYFQDNIDRGSSAENYTEQPTIESTHQKEPSLQEHLLWQLNLSVDSDRKSFIGSCIIGNINNDGYLLGNINDVAEICNASELEVLSVLKIIQEFEPLGVGARSLQECLMIQAQADEHSTPLILKLIKS